MERVRRWGEGEKTLSQEKVKKKSGRKTEISEKSNGEGKERVRKG